MFISTQGPQLESPYDGDLPRPGGFGPITGLSAFTLAFSAAPERSEKVRKWQQFLYGSYTWNKPKIW